MKRHTQLVAGFHGTASLALIGCASTGISSRIQEKSATFNQLNAVTQKQIQEGNIDKGYKQDMVYIALGKPSRIETKEAPEGPVEVWVYKNLPLPSSGGFRGIVYNTDNQGISPGFAPVTPWQKKSRIQQAGEARKAGGQAGNLINNDALQAAAEIADMPTGTLYVFFFQGRVYKLNLKP